MSKQGENLILELKSNPQAFNKFGKSYELLQEFFKGMPVGRVMLQNSDRILFED
jgi:hypothetical protein